MINIKTATPSECDIDLISDNIDLFSDNIAFVSQNVLNNVINDCFGSENVIYNIRLNLTFKLELDKKIVYFPLIKSQKHITFLIKRTTFFNHIDYFKMQKQYTYVICNNVNDNNVNDNNVNDSNILYIITDDVNFLSTDFKQSIFPEKSYIMEYGKFDFGELQQYYGKTLLSKYKTHKNNTVYVMFFANGDELNNFQEKVSEQNYEIAIQWVVFGGFIVNVYENEVKKGY